MDQAVAKSTDVVLQYGIGGVFILFLAGMSWLLWRALTAERDKTGSLTREAIAGLNATATSVKELADGLKRLDERAEDRHARIASLPDQLRGIEDVGKGNRAVLENNRDAMDRIEAKLDGQPPRRRAGT